MGGKNKKHKAPGAAALRAAVSASRAKSAEAGAAGEAQNKKPVARPPPAAAAAAAAAAASTRESRVKQGTSDRPAPSFSLQAAATCPDREAFALGRTLVSNFISPAARAAISLSGTLVLDQSNELVGPPEF